MQDDKASVATCRPDSSGPRKVEAAHVLKQLTRTERDLVSRAEPGIYLLSSARGRWMATFL